MITRILTAALLLAHPTVSQNLSDARLNLVKQRLAEGAHNSWEYGTRALAILSLDVPLYSPFNSKQSLPPPATIPQSISPPLDPVFSIARSAVLPSSSSGSGPPSETTSATSISPSPSPSATTSPSLSPPRSLALDKDGAAADPASMGTSVLLANWTSQPPPASRDWAQAAKEELDWLYSDAVPKTPDGAWSHRTEKLQLWSDFTYMVPPFLAYYGAVSSNKSLIDEAYNQIKLYRNYLRDSSTGMWRHIVMGNGTDSGFWATGNGWSALGMLRVLATIQRSQFANAMKHQQIDIANWVREIHWGVYSRLNTDTLLFTNYIDQPDSFSDASSTAILAASVYRISVMWGDHRWVKMAERSRKAIIEGVSNAKGAGAGAGGGGCASGGCIDGEGWLNPVVDPYSWSRQGEHSPEGQAFVLEMQAAWRDWDVDGRKGANGGVSVRCHGGCWWVWWWWWWVAVGVWGLV